MCNLKFVAVGHTVFGVETGGCSESVDQIHGAAQCIDCVGGFHRQHQLYPSIWDECQFDSGLIVQELKLKGGKIRNKLIFSGSIQNMVLNNISRVPWNPRCGNYVIQAGRQ